MANELYGKGREGFLAGTIDWDTDNIKVTLVDDTDYTRSINVDDFYDDVTVAGRVATSGNLTTKTVTLGTADAADITYSAVSGDVSEELVIWSDSGVESTSPLIANINVATGLPVTPNGGDITVTWDSGANKIFTL